MHHYRGNPNEYTSAGVARTRTLYCSKCSFWVPFGKDKIRVTEQIVAYRYTCPECGYTVEREYKRNG